MTAKTKAREEQRNAKKRRQDAELEEMKLRHAFEKAELEERQAQYDVRLSEEHDSESWQEMALTESFQRIQLRRQEVRGNARKREFEASCQKMAEFEAEERKRKAQ